jgi:type I site-specific restriction endonuclease
MTDKQELSEQDICTKYILPALVRAGWDITKQVREQVYFTDGRIYVKGNQAKRGKAKKADYILYYKPNIPIAVIEAKKNIYPLGAGMQQALNYAEILDLPVAFSSNGDGFLEHDRSGFSNLIEQEFSLDNFPTPEQLWQKYKKYKGISTPEAERIASFDYFFDTQGRQPRYYQQIAINRTVEAIAKGQNRLLLVMATGAGKTYTAFQIIYRLWKNGIKKKVLFLADRTALISQTKRGDFRHFKDKMTVIKNKVIDTAFEIYLALYQGLVNYDDDILDAYKEFDPDYFDLIIVDECHRGSAADDSKWREILEYFSGATQIGLTATPKETLVTTSLRDYTKQNLLQEFSSLDNFLTRWNEADKKAALIAELRNHDIIAEELEQEIKKDLDLFDLICYVAWNRPPLTRKQRAENVKKRDYFTKYGEKARDVLNALLEKYANEGIENIEDLSVLKLEPLKQFGSPPEIVKIFGGKSQYISALRELTSELYKIAA